MSSGVLFGDTNVQVAHQTERVNVGKQGEVMQLEDVKPEVNETERV